MRRLFNFLIVVLIFAGLFMPSAMATIAAMRSCCVPAASANVREHCAGMAPHPAAGLYSKPGCCGHGCCPTLGLSPSKAGARPRAYAIAPAAASSHSFLHEFYPSQPSGDEAENVAQRAPPANSIRY